jgi:hypothetical protein
MQQQELHDEWIRRLTWGATTDHQDKRFYQRD